MTVTPLAPTPPGHTHVLVTQDTLVMDSHVPMSTNAPSTPIHVTLMPHVQILSALSTAAAALDIPVSFFF